MEGPRLLLLIHQLLQPGENHLKRYGIHVWHDITELGKIVFFYVLYLVEALCVEFVLHIGLCP